MNDYLDILASYDPYQVPEMRALLEGGVDRLADLLASVASDPIPAGITRYVTCVCRSEERSRRQYASRAFYRPGTGVTG
jgi:hypothetical protein